MDLYKIMSWAFIFGGTMLALQMLNIYGHLDATEIHIFGTMESAAPLNVGPVYGAIKLLLEIPQNFQQQILSLNPQDTSIFGGIQGLTGATVEGLFNSILYVITFLYFFVVTTLFGKISTIFTIERDQKIFFLFLSVLYFAIIKVLGSW